MISLSAMCLALTIYFEARGEPQLGQRYVGHVVMNRAEDDYKDNICAAVFDPHQFEWTGGIKRSKNLAVMAWRAKKQVNEPDSWKASVAIANRVIARKQDITNGAKFFNRIERGVKYQTQTKPRTIGNHIFY